MKIRTGIAALALAVTAVAAALFSNLPPAEAQNSKGGGYNTPSRVVQASQLTPTTGTGSVVLATSPTLVTPTLGAANATSVNFGGNALNAYTVSSFTATATAGWTTTPTAAVKYTLIGNMVTMDWPNTMSGTSNATNATFSGIPVALRPAVTKILSGIRTIDNGGADSWGLLVINTDGTGTFYKDANGTNWTASGSKVIDSGSVTYTLQ